MELTSEPQPDLLLLIDPACGGQAQIGEDGYVDAAPELVVEVAVSNASYDLHDKLNAYRRSGVREYVVHRVLDEEVDWFVLEGDEFRPHSPGEDGLFRSTIFPGLWLDAPALVRGDLASVLAVVGQGAASPEHAAFVKHMAEIRGTENSE